MQLVEDSSLCSGSRSQTKNGAEVERTRAHAPEQHPTHAEARPRARNPDIVSEGAAQRATDGSDDKCKHD